MAQIDLPFLLVFPLSQHFQPMQSTQQLLPVPSYTDPQTLRSHLRRHPSIRSASPSHAQHIQSWHSLVAPFLLLLFSLLSSCSISSRTSLIFYLSPLLSAGLICMIIFHPLLFPSAAFCALSLLLGHQNQSYSHRSCVFAPASASSTSLPLFSSPPSVSASV